MIGKEEGCVGFGDIAKLNILARGMSQSAVQLLLGRPKQTELKDNKIILKYSLHQWFHGWKPVYLLFNEKDQLVEWFVDEKEFADGQKRWMNYFKLWKQ